jgi:hypothetical protein
LTSLPSNYATQISTTPEACRGNALHNQERIYQFRLVAQVVGSAICRPARVRSAASARQAADLDDGGSRYARFLLLPRGPTPLPGREKHLVFMNSVDIIAGGAAHDAKCRFESRRADGHRDI